MTSPHLSRLLARPDRVGRAGRSGRSAPRPRSGRADIQGLRALAVGLVIADHVFGQPVGGFIGVDVFFVLSGFLITHLLISEHGRDGRISYLDFYRRRVRRIVPVATLVVVVTVVATYLLLSDARGSSVATDGLWAFVFAANWHFAETGTNYFASGGPVSPLQHYWSLSVEEQFYIVWPTVLVLALVLAGRSARTAHRDRVVLGAVAGVLAVAAFVYSVGHSSSSPVVAYFSTFDRAWELLVGALVATSAPLWRRLPTGVRPVLAWAGLAAIAASTVLISETDAFPAPWAALPVLGTAVVVAAGIGAEPRYLLPLRNPVTSYLGDISYSLYLWHFPVVVLLLAYFPDAGLTYQLVAIALTLALSVGSFHLVEDPVRRSQWLEPRGRRLLRSGPVNHSHRLANTWLAIGVVATVAVVSGLVVSQRGADDQEQLLSAAPITAGTRGADDTGADGTDGATGADGGQDEAAASREAFLQARIEQSLGLDRFPALTPSVDELGLGQWFEDMNDYGCVAVEESTVDDCSFGPPDASTTTVVLGDSIAVAYMPTVRKALEAGRVQQLTLQECPAFDAPTDRLEGGAFPECDAFKPWAVREINQIKPDLVLLSSTYGYTAGALKSGATGSAAVAEIADGLERTIESISAPGRIVAVVSPPPGAGDLTECVTSVGSPSDCEAPVSPDWFAWTDMERDVAESTGAYYVDTRDWFCADSACPGFVGTTPAYVDGEHLTLQYAGQLAGVMRDALVDVVAQATEATDRADGKAEDKADDQAQAATR